MPTLSNHRAEELSRAMMTDLVFYFERRVIETHEAQDLVSQTLLALCASPEKIPADDTRARMWCFGIARNVLRDFYSRATRSRDLHEALAQRAHLTGGIALSAEENVLIREASLTLAAALRALDPEVRELMLMMDVEGQGIRQAARRLRIGDLAARERRTRGIAELRGHLVREAQ